MYNIRVLNTTADRTIEENFICSHYKRELVSKDKESFMHELTLYNVPDYDDPVIIDLYKMMEDINGCYEQDVFIMNENGKTIDRF